MTYKWFLGIFFFVIGTFLIMFYHNCAFGEFWQVPILVWGIVCLVWSELFFVMDW